MPTPVAEMTRPRNRGRRLLMVFIALLLAVLVCLLTARLLETLRFRNGLAEYKDATLPQSVTIVRDDWGVPTIFGDTDADTAFGLAFAHAEDDFPTIEQRLAAVRRQLGAMNGAEGAKVDYFAHLIDARGQIEAGLDRISPETREMAAAYARGLNHFAANHADQVTRTQLFPVTEQDILEGFVLVSPLFFGLDRVVGDLADGKNLDLSATFGPVETRGSNAFAIAPTRMADGSTVLISNSHQPWFGPAAWYEARVVSGQGMRFQGATFPGSPVMLMGHNEHLGWTNTVNSPDMVDIYKLEMDETGKRYRLDGRWRDLERRRVWLRVKMGPLVLPVPQWVERSAHGPVIRNDQGAYAFRYGSMGEVRHLEQYYRLTKTTNLQEWREVMAMQAIPGTNFIYADRAGNIAMLYNASLPERDPDVDWGGVLPGDRSDLIWKSYEPAARIPFLLNPPSGFIFNANNAPFDATHPEDDFTPEDFPDLVGIESRQTNRALRAQTLLSADTELTYADLDRIKMDTSIDPSSDIAAKITEAISVNDPEISALLMDWDGNFDGVGRADALALYIVHHLWPHSYFGVDVPETRTVVAMAKSHFQTHFGRLDPPLGEFLRLRHGDQDQPLTGGPGVLRAIHSKLADDGRLVAWNGDSYILRVRWPAGGAAPETETIMAHGASPAHPDTPHHSDQIPLFVTGRYKASPLPSMAERPAQR